MIEKFLETQHKKGTQLCLKVGFTGCCRKESSPSPQAVVRPPNVELLRCRMHERSAKEEKSVCDMSSATSDASQSERRRGSVGQCNTVRIDDKYPASQLRLNVMTLSLAAASEERKARLLALRRKRAGEEVEGIEYVPFFSSGNSH